MPEPRNELLTMDMVLEAQETLNSQPDLWYETYGFPHHCHCADDHLKHNLGEVTECWADMAADALEHCKLQQKALRLIATGVVPEPETFAQEFTTAPTT